MSLNYRVTFGDGVARRLHDEDGKPMPAGQSFYLDAGDLLRTVDSLGADSADGARLECVMEADGLGLSGKPERGMEIAMLPGEWASAFFEALERMEKGQLQTRDVSGKRRWTVAKEGEIKPRVRPVPEVVSSHMNGIRQDRHGKPAGWSPKPGGRPERKDGERKFEKRFDSRRPEGDRGGDRPKGPRREGSDRRPGRPMR